MEGCLCSQYQTDYFYHPCRNPAGIATLFRSKILLMSSLNHLAVLENILEVKRWNTAVSRSFLKLVSSSSTALKESQCNCLGKGNKRATVCARILMKFIVPFCYPQLYVNPSVLTLFADSQLPNKMSSIDVKPLWLLFLLFVSPVWDTAQQYTPAVEQCVESVAPVKNSRKISFSPPLSFFMPSEVPTKERHCVYVTGNDDGLVNSFESSLNYF